MIIKDLASLKDKIAKFVSADRCNIEIYEIDARPADFSFVIDCTINRESALVILDADSEEVDEILFG